MNNENTNEAGANVPASSVPAEEWREIPGYDYLYEASSSGRVRSWHRGRRQPLVLRPATNKAGYFEVALSLDGKMRTWPVHQLVAMAFIGPRPEGLVVCHNDGVKKNLAPSNLRYGTHAENAEDKIAHGSHVWGELVGNSTLTSEDVTAILESTDGPVALGRKYGVTYSAISGIRSGRSWRALTGAEGVTLTGQAHGTERPGAKLDDETVMALRFGGMTDTQAAQKLGINPGTAAKARHGYTWKHLPLPGKEKDDIDDDSRAGPQAE